MKHIKQNMITLSLLLILGSSNGFCVESIKSELLKDETSFNDSTKIITAKNNIGENQSKDVRITSLEELVVEGQNLRIEGEKIIAIPTKSDKNLSNSPGSLIDKMNIPFLKGNGYSISTTTGEPVKIFINGREATPADLEMFWPNLAKRVEYYPSPSDPKYLRYDRVINFVMQEYKVGGVTKVYGHQSFPEISGFYGLNSKLVYKSMSYTLGVSGDASGTSKKIYESEETFNNTCFDGVRYDRITKISETKPQEERSRDINVKATAQYYDNNGFSLYNDVQLSIVRSPKNLRKFNLSFTPDIIAGENSFSDADNRNLNVNYVGFLAKSWRDGKFFQTDLSYSYSHNDYNSSYQIEGLPAILNSSIENAHNAGVTLTYSQRINTRFDYSLQVPGSVKTFHTVYLGSVPQSSDIKRFTYGAYVKLNYRLSKIVRLGLNPGIGANSTKSGTKSTTALQPSLSFTTYVFENTKNYSSFMLNYVKSVTGDAEISDVLTRQSELIWLMGNPYLHDPSSLNLSISHSLIFNNKISCFFNMREVMEFNPIAFSMTHPEKDMDGLIKTFTNNGTFSKTSFTASVSYRPVNGLSLRGEGTYTHYSGHPYYDGDRIHLSDSGVTAHINADYTWRNFSFSVSYDHWGRALLNGGATKRNDFDSYSLYFRYGNGNFLAFVSCRDLFIKRSWQRETTYAGDYESIVRTGSVGNRVTIGFDYMFGYGKKVDPQIGTVTKLDGNSSVLQ